MIIFLYGPPGSGKSSTGRELAAALNFAFTDLDEAVQLKAGLPIAEIFSRQGEPAFRLLESAVLRQTLAAPPASKLGRVIALGGGALLDAANRSRVETAGRVVLLEASTEMLLKRLELQPAKRPLLSGDPAAKLQALLEQRAHHYASFPLRVDGGLSAAESAWQIQMLLGVFRVSGMGQPYDVRVQTGGLDRTGENLGQRGLRAPVALVADQTVAGLYAQRTLESLAAAGYAARLVTFPAGEAHKTIATLSHLWSELLSVGLERGSTVLALGGGVTGDLAGFAAATYLRGVRWVNLPTSLLACVDAGLGGKTGVDLPQGKNLVGAFHPPSLVLVDPQVLDSLPDDEFRSGLAEVVKHGVIGDPVLFDLCAQGWEAVHARRDELVRRAMAVKIRIIQEDPYEQGRRAALNLGHTLGHAVEQASQFRLKHGEAVAIGMVHAARLSEQRGLAQAGLADSIARVLHGLGLPTEVPADLDPAAIEAAMLLDKKKSAGKLRWVLPVRVGEVVVDGSDS